MVEVAEWFRHRAVNPGKYPHVGSNPTLHPTMPAWDSGRLRLPRKQDALISHAQVRILLSAQPQEVVQLVRIRGPEP